MDDILEVVKNSSVEKLALDDSQHKVHIRSGTRWPVTISRFAVEQDRKWLEATDLQKPTTLISIRTSALTTPLSIN